MSFTIKYKATENGVPDSISADNYTVKVGGTENADGNGFMTLGEYVGNKITLDSRRMNELTSSMNTEDIKNSINNIISDYSTAKNNWVDLSNQFSFTLDNNLSTDTKLVFNGTPNNELITNIDVISNNNKVKLKLDKTFQDKLLGKQPNLFDDIKKIDVNANITVHN